MIGNDVIDLDLAATESNWKRRGWLEKIFLPSERQLINNATDQNVMVWILWSMKEAAYKIHHRKTKTRGFIPQQLICSILHAEGKIIYGKVGLGCAVFYTKTNVGKKFVHTIATSDRKIFRNLSICFSGNYIKNYNTVNIFKDDSGIPFLFNKASGKREILSISHHGKYCSYLSTTTTLYLLFFYLYLANPPNQKTKWKMMTFSD